MLTYEYDTKPGGLLILKADAEEQVRIRELVAEKEGDWSPMQMDDEVLAPLLCNSELEFINAEDCGALTDAPILGLRKESGEVEAAWAYMDYQLRSFVDDLLETGRAVFRS